MKKKFKLVGLAVTLLVIATIGVSLAYFRTETETQTPISVGNLGVELRLDSLKNENYIHDGALDVQGGMPGNDYDYPVYAYNSGDYESYIRVTLTRYWKNKNNGVKCYDADASQILLQLNGQNLQTNTDNWIVDATDSNSEVVYMYYKEPVKANEKTDHIIDKIVIGNIQDQNFYSNLELKVDVEVDAIQAAAAKDAMMAEWGLNVSFDDNGRISEVLE